jgi:hypothetical protein
VGQSIGPAHSPRTANYTIEARLDPDGRLLTGSEVIEWRNQTNRTVDDLQLHLYWNAWRDNQSTWLQEAALAGQTFNHGELEHGWLDITSVRLLGSGASLTGRTHFISPDDGNGNDRTVMQVWLPASVEPGGGVHLEVKWTAHVPRPFARTGLIGRFAFIAQWFPKLGVLQDAGWNCHQFHYATEFFSDYGVYNVALTVPRGWPVGATGVEREYRDNADGTSTHRFIQEDVHDFAWTTSPDYIVRTARFEHTSLPPVELRLLLQPEHRGQAERHFDATRAALTSYGEWFGAYPYGHLTIVDPAFQSEANGMEYPTLFVAGTHWLVTSRRLDLEGLVIHEAGHQFWYGLVGSNEFERAWMDEGFNTYSAARTLEAVYGPPRLELRYFGGFVPYLLKDIALRRETDLNGLGAYRALATREDTSRPTYRFFPSQRVGNALSYAKTALWLNTLERFIGWPTLQRVFATYFERWRFRHPDPSDFFATVDEVTGRDLGWFVDQVYRSSNAFDYAVEDLRSTVNGSMFRTTVVVRRNGEATFPVDVRTTFVGGKQVVERWDGLDRWTIYRYDRPERAVSAEVDPDRVLLLDTHYTNNSKTLRPRGPEAATKWSLKWMVWFEDLLLSWAALA